MMGPAFKAQDMHKTWKHVTGHSDADSAGNQMKKKCNQKCMLLGALSAELIFAQATLKSIGLSILDTREIMTAAQYARWQRN